MYNYSFLNKMADFLVKNNEIISYIGPETATHIVFPRGAIISSNCLMNNNNITDIFIPKEVEQIQENFCHCLSKLKNVIFED